MLIYTTDPNILAARLVKEHQGDISKARVSCETWIRSSHCQANPNRRRVFQSALRVLIGLKPIHWKE